MTRYFCDRCKKELPNGLFNHIDEQVINGIVTQVQGAANIRKMDLCDDCYSEFRKKIEWIIRTWADYKDRDNLLNEMYANMQGI